jgi:hypothetical protein
MKTIIHLGSERYDSPLQDHFQEVSIHNLRSPKALSNGIFCGDKVLRDTIKDQVRYIINAPRRKNYTDYTIQHTLALIAAIHETEIIIPFEIFLMVNLQDTNSFALSQGEPTRIIKVNKQTGISPGATDFIQQAQATQVPFNLTSYQQTTPYPEVLSHTFKYS